MINYVISIISIILEGIFRPILLPMLGFSIIVCVLSIIRRFVSV